MIRKRAFGELEISILSTIRKREAVTVRDVFEALGKEGGYTTVMTVMNRLVDKGELNRKKNGRQYTYWVESQSTPSKGILKRLKDKIFAGDTTAMVAYLLDTDETITENELNNLERLIEGKRRGREAS